MAPNIHSLNSPKKRFAKDAHKTASGRSTKKPRRYRSGNTTSDDDEDEDEEEAEVRTITEVIGGGRAAGKRTIKSVPAPIGAAAPGPSKFKQTNGKFNKTRFEREAGPLELSLSKPTAPSSSSSSADPLVLRPRQSGTGQKGWKGEGAYEVELPSEAGEGSSVTVKFTVSASIVKKKSTPTAIDDVPLRTHWGGTNVLGGTSLPPNIPSPARPSTTSGKGRASSSASPSKKLAELGGEEDKPEEVVHVEDEEVAVDDDDDELVMEPAPEPKAEGKGKKKAEVSGGRALGGGAGSSKREAREKMLKAMEERMKGSIGRGVQAREGAGRLSKALADEQKKTSNRVQVESEKELTVNLYD